MAKSIDVSYFTNIYQIPKTLRFELIPIGGTQKLLEKNDIFQTDEEVYKAYQRIKPIFDDYHRKFTKNSLENLSLNVNQFFVVYKKYKDNRGKLRKDLESKSKGLRKKISDSFNVTAEQYKKKYESKGLKIKGKGVKFLFEKDILDILEFEYPDQAQVFDRFRGFYTYFSNFNESRKNFYKDDDKAGRIANRVVEDNLTRFCDNVIVFEERYKQVGFKHTKDLFNVKSFSNFLTQAGIDKYNEQIGKVNAQINEYRQKSGKKEPFFKILYKQILAIPSKQKDLQDEFIKIERDHEVFSTIKKFIKENEDNNKIIKELIDGLVKGKYNLKGVYFSSRANNTLSNKFFTSWDVFAGLLPKENGNKVKEFVPLVEISKTLSGIDMGLKDLFSEDKVGTKFLQSSKMPADKVFWQLWQKEWQDVFKDYKSALVKVRTMLKEEKIYKKTKKQREIIKSYADSALKINQIGKYFSLFHGKGEKERRVSVNGEDSSFYNSYDVDWYPNTKRNWQYYNELRNYLTKKPYDDSKIKLNFKNSTLLDGWDENKERANYGVILIKDDKYYLAVMTQEDNKVFSTINNNKEAVEIGEDFFLKMVYKFLPDPSKMLPKVCFSKKNKELFDPSKEILEIRRKEAYKKESKYYTVKRMQKFIEFYQEALPKYEGWQVYDFNHIKPVKEYKDNIGEFFRDVELDNWRLTFSKVSADYINNKVNEGKLYLFQIYNKDFAEKHKGKRNLHTVYWQSLFADNNLKDPIIKLNGQAEIFYRKASLKKKKKKLKNKKKKYDIYEFKRYTEDKILFHCPTTLNMKASTDGKYSSKPINLLINNQVAKNKEIRIIGIDRGEKHLMYLSVNDLEGNIYEIKSLNEINGVNYHEILDNKERERAKQRESWQEIKQIKDFKKGYVSQAVHEIAKIVWDCLDKGEFPIIVFENLNTGFKRERFRIEKQVYQNFELALAKKLNYLVDKKRANHLAGLQLTPFVRNFSDIENTKQFGNIFYVPASYTSAVCPVCGFRKNLTNFFYQNQSQALRLLNSYNFKIYKEDDKYKFIYELPKERKQRKTALKIDLFKDQESKKEFVFYSNVDRLGYNRKKRKTYELEPTEKLDQLFLKKGFDMEEELIEQLNGPNFSAENFKTLIWIINMIFQVRNGETIRDKKGHVLYDKCKDFIHCPACGFHSDNNWGRLKNRYKGKAKFEFNGDANGAYNIARKGSLLVRKIKLYAKENKSDFEKFKSENLLTNMEEWDKFAMK